MQLASMFSPLPHFLGQVETLAAQIYPMGYDEHDRMEMEHPRRQVHGLNAGIDEFDRARPRQPPCSQRLCALLIFTLGIDFAGEDVSEEVRRYCADIRSMAEKTHNYNLQQQAPRMLELVARVEQLPL